MNKKIFKNDLGEIHFGNNAPVGFKEGTKTDLQNALKNLGGKKLWRCNVCNDLRIGLEPLEVCPTCYTQNAYVEIDVNELKKLVKIL